MQEGPGKLFRFGEFCLDTSTRVLTAGDNSVVNATPKALALLCVLVEAEGRVVSKEDLISQVWFDSYVEEANLSHHISKLRRALSEKDDQKFIETVPKRGYRFVVPLQSSTVPGELIPGTGVLPKRKSTVRRAVIPIGVISALIVAAAAFFMTGRFQQNVENHAPKPATAVNSSMSMNHVTKTGDRGSSTISPNGKFMAYAQIHASGEGVLYVRQTDTNTEIKLVEGAKRSFGATAFSPDSASLFYVAKVPGEPQALYRIPVLGGQPTRIAGDLHFFFTLSGDGTQAAFYRTDDKLNQTSIVIAALDGSGSEKILATFNDLEKSVDSVPALSPDGKTIIFGFADAPNAVDNAPARVEVFSLSVDDGSIKKLSGEKWMGIGMMKWMPDASGVVFIGYHAGTRNQLHFVSYPDGELRSITNETGGYGNYGLGITADGKTMVAEIIEFSSQLWSSRPDGKTQDAAQLTTSDADGGQGLATLSNGEILYTSRAGATHDIWTLRKANNALEAFPITDDPSNEIELATSGDGRTLVFISDRSGTRHIYRSDIDGANSRQLTFGDSVDSNPDLTADGEWIFYASLSPDGKRIWKLPIEGGTPIRVTDFESVAPVVSPDGKMMACIRPAANAGEQATLEVLSLQNGDLIGSFGGVPFDWYQVPARWTPDGLSIIYRRTDTTVGNLWKQNLTGGEPQQFTDFTSLKLYDFAFARDGKSLVTARGTIKVTVVMLKNFL